LYNPNAKLFDVGFYIVNYDKFSKDDAVAKTFIEWGGLDALVLDEAHLLKTPTANRTKTIYKVLAPHAKKVIPLSGTPAPNHAAEIYTHIRYLAPELITQKNGHVMTQTDFENRYCIVASRKFGNGPQVRVILGSQNLDELRDRTKNFFFRRTKADCLKDLPPLQFVTLPVKPTLDGLAMVKANSDILKTGMNDDEVLKALQSNDEHISKLRAALGLAKATASANYLQDFLFESKGKVLVFAHHTKVIDHLMSLLSDFNPVKIDGRDSSAQRGAAVNHFLNDSKCRVFIGNLQAASTGLTLINEKNQCRDVFFVEASYTPGNNLQAACRVHRLGQKDGVLARYMVATGTIDDRIMDIVARKTNEIAELLDGAKKDGQL
jgi:SWI/SNF-related matrix-associated actin-dependent regulator 1 of chromatin subfamily A